MERRRVLDQMTMATVLNARYREAIGSWWARFMELLAVSAGKILRGIAWTAVPSGGGIEDRYLFSLEPGVVERLQPAFQTSQRDENFWKLVPGSFESLTI